MKITITKRLREAGKVGKIALLWLIGIPLPIAIIIIFLGGCR
jgi:hypothetical protein